MTPSIPSEITQKQPLAHSRELMALGYSLLLIISYLGYNFQLLHDYMQQFWILTILLTLHNLAEFYTLARKGTKHFWLKPVIAGSVIVFFLQHGALTNYLYRGLDGEFNRTYNDLLIRDPLWLSKTMALVLAASVVYWFGYKMTAGITLANSYLQVYERFWNFRISHYKLFATLIIGWSIKLLLNYYGALGHRFGYVLEHTGHIPPFIYRLKIFENLSLLFLTCFMFLAIQHKRNLFYWWVFIAGLLFELVFSLTTGARSTILFVFLAVFLVDYFLRGHLRVIWIIGGALLLVFAMTVLQEFKAFAFSKSNVASEIKDPIEFIQQANNYRNQLAKTGNITKSAKHALYLTSIGRFNYVNEATQVIRYKEVKGIKLTDPDFLGPFFTFPIFAVIPQFWVQGKPTEGYGAWVTHLLLNTRKYDIAMSPVGYSYLAGGALLVLLVFFVCGILMRMLEVVFNHIHTVIAFILFLALLKQLVLFDSIVWATFLNLIRYGLLLPPLLWLLLKRWSVN